MCRKTPFQLLEWDWITCSGSFTLFDLQDERALWMSRVTLLARSRARISSDPRGLSLSVSRAAALWDPGPGAACSLTGKPVAGHPCRPPLPPPPACLSWWEPRSPPFPLSRSRPVASGSVTSERLRAAGAFIRRGARSTQFLGFGAWRRRVAGLGRGAGASPTGR